MGIASIFGIIAAVLLGAVLLAALIFLISKLFGITFLILRNIFRFIGEEVTDTLRFVGAILASILFAPLVVLSVVIGRWSASKHYSGALMSELRSASRCVYRIAIGNVARLFGLSQALEGVEQRVPEVMAGAPTKDKPSKRVGMFEGYKIVGSLKGGGSGGKLYIAEPDEVKQAVFAKRKLGKVDQVVIKVFSLKDGSSLPQIVRESRALDAARSLGLVLEHQMAPERFYYVMRYVPGESLAVVTSRLHSLSTTEGLANDDLKAIMSYSQDLLVALDTYHNADLWHKDVKPDNIIVDGRNEDAKAHLVDFGLITPMRSAMTLTTHGTEYFRDPELVRQALRGVKVHQIDGSKFDIYGAGAVLFSMIENSFPAHGGLSQLSKRCPEALRWIVRRAMTDYDRRYPSAAAMLADLRVVLNAQDPFTVKPIDLPSVSQGDVAAANQVESEPISEFDRPAAVTAGSPVPPIPQVPQRPPVGQTLEPDRRVGRPNTTVTDWWSGRYVVAGTPIATKKKTKKSKKNAPHKPVNIHANAGSAQRVSRPLRDVADRKPASEQVRDARHRAKGRRVAAGKRIDSRRKQKNYSNTPGVAVVFAGLLGLAVLFAGGILGLAMFTPAFHNEQTASTPTPPEAPYVDGQHVTIKDGKIQYSKDGMSVSIVNGDVSVEVPHDRETHKNQNNEEILVDAEILVVPLLSSSVDAQEFDEFERHLQLHGVTLVGSPESSVAGDQSIELVASLHNAMGAMPIDSPDLPMRVSQWLESKSFDGVFIIGTDPSHDHGRGILVMEGLYASMVYDGGTVEGLLGTLERNGYGVD